MAERPLQSDSHRRRDTAAERVGREPAGRTNRPDSDRVARRAYERFQARGGEHGRDQEDWFAAEQELRGGADRAQAEIAGDVDARRLEDSARNLGRSGKTR